MRPGGRDPLPPGLGHCPVPCGLHSRGHRLRLRLWNLLCRWGGGGRRGHFAGIDRRLWRDRCLRRNRLLRLYAGPRLHLGIRLRGRLPDRWEHLAPRRLRRPAGLRFARCLFRRRCAFRVAPSPLFFLLFVSHFRNHARGLLASLQY